MTVLLAAAVPYVLTTAVIILIWRFLRTDRPYLLLSVIYLSAFLFWHLPNTLLIGWQPARPTGAEEWLAAALLYVLALHFLLGNYTCIEGDSPSMILFTLIDEAGSEGCTREEIVSGFRELGHVEDRLDTMERRGLLKCLPDGSLAATRTGKFIRWCFDRLPPPGTGKDGS